MKCYACNELLRPEIEGSDTQYQFDNALWIGLYGGYGMFVDQMPDYTGEDRALPGRPDLESVICHDCAHSLCDAVWWLKRLIQPEKSHAHHYDQIDRLMAEGHVGWDLDRRRENQ